MVRDIGPRVAHRTLEGTCPSLAGCWKSPGADAVRLVETSGRAGDYACLSHCWGPQLLIRTLKQNYEDHKAGIPCGQLPPTFRVLARYRNGKRYYHTEIPRGTIRTIDSWTYCQIE